MGILQQVRHAAVEILFRIVLQMCVAGDVRRRACVAMVSVSVIPALIPVAGDVRRRACVAMVSVSVIPALILARKIPVLATLAHQHVAPKMTVPEPVPVHAAEILVQHVCVSLETNLHVQVCAEEVVPAVLRPVVLRPVVLRPGVLRPGVQRAVVRVAVPAQSE
ncbi:MAG: hypothetical protein UY87_C0081G0008 [Candidatus Peribacteria bacterium GW2011_GWC2_54_8]|nr:MAG: hypothetical protein UY87_C0081G0008 [Candidatus Peribacteria bacterium GW2011_GWC2_54_8]